MSFFSDIIRAITGASVKEIEVRILNIPDPDKGRSPPEAAWLIGYP